MGCRLPGMVCFLLKCSLAELLSQVIPIKKCNVPKHFLFVRCLTCIPLSALQPYPEVHQRCRMVQYWWNKIFWQHYGDTKINNTHIQECISVDKNYLLDWLNIGSHADKAITHRGVNLDFWLRQVVWIDSLKESKSHSWLWTLAIPIRIKFGFVCAYNQVDGKEWEKYVGWCVAFVQCIAQCNCMMLPTSGSGWVGHLRWVNCTLYW